MAAVKMKSLFPAGATVSLCERGHLDEPHVRGKIVASGTVQTDSTLEINGLDAGGYWAFMETSDLPAVAVTAKAKVGKDDVHEGDLDPDNVRTRVDPAQPQLPRTESTEPATTSKSQPPTAGAVTTADTKPKRSRPTRKEPAAREVTGARTSANTRPVPGGSRARKT